MTENNIAFIGSSNENCLLQ